MKYLSYIFIIVLLTVCTSGKKTQKINNTEIRVINNSEYILKNVSLFSMFFNDLKPNDVSEYKILRYNSLEDDPLIYVTVDNQNFALYLKIPQETVKSTYVVDSIDMKYKIIHVSLQVDN